MVFVGEPTESAGVCLSPQISVGQTLTDSTLSKSKRYVCTPGKEGILEMQFEADDENT
jgi:hypothetical protein